MLVNGMQDLYDIMGIDLNLETICKEYKIINPIINNDSLKFIRRIKNSLEGRSLNNIIALILIDNSGELARAMQLNLDKRTSSLRDIQNIIDSRMNQYYCIIHNKRFIKSKLDDIEPLFYKIDTNDYVTAIGDRLIYNKPRLMNLLYERIIWILYNKVLNKKGALTTKRLMNLQKYKVLHTIYLAKETNITDNNILSQLPTEMVFIADNEDFYIVSDDCKLYKMNETFKINYRAFNRGSSEEVFRIMDIYKASDLLIEYGRLESLVEIRALYEQNIHRNRLETRLYNTPDIFDITYEIRQAIPNCIVMLNMDLITTTDIKYSYVMDKLIIGKNDNKYTLFDEARNNYVAREINETEDNKRNVYL